MKALPTYVENVLGYLGKKEEKYLGTPAKEAADRMRKELIDESLTAKNPGPRDGSKDVVASVKLKNPWPLNNTLPRDFVPDFSKWTFELKTNGITSTGLTIELVVKKGILYGMVPANQPNVGRWHEIAVLSHFLDYNVDPGNLIEGTVRAEKAFGNLTNGNAVFREIIEKGLKAENFTPDTYATETAGGTFQLCVGCRRKWMGVPKGKLPEPLMSNRCPEHEYMAGGCECEHESHFDKGIRQEAKAYEKLNKERDIEEVVKRMDNGERVRVKKEFATSILAHLYSAKPPRGDDAEIWEDEPGYVRLFFKGVPLAKSGLLGKNPKRSPRGPKMPEEVIQKFEELAQLQRDKPETAMMRARGFMGGGVLGHAIEHVGDINHRMNEGLEGFNENDHGFDTVMKKARDLHFNRPGDWMSFKKEHEWNMRSNYDYYKENGKGGKPFTMSYEEFKAKVAELLKAYADEHAKLPVYNQLQWTAREAAIALGNQNFARANYMLQKILAYQNNKQGWLEDASKYDPNFEEKMKTNPRRSEGMKPSDFDQEQLKIGREHEAEHTDSPDEAMRIAMDHLAEDPDYYKKLAKMEAGACNPKNKKNPTNPRQKEMSAFKKAFLESHLGDKARQLPPAKRDEKLKELEHLYREFELIADKYSDLILEILFGLKVKRKKDDPHATDLELPSGEGRTELKVREHVYNRYIKLNLQMWVIAFLVKIADFEKPSIMATVNELEGDKKSLAELLNKGNRLADATVMFNLIGSVILKNADPKRLHLALMNENNKEKIAAIYKRAITEASEEKKKVGEKAAEKKKEIVAESGLEVEYTPDLMAKLGAGVPLSASEEAAKQRLFAGVDPELLAKAASQVAGEGIETVRAIAIGRKDPKAPLGLKKFDEKQLMQIIKADPEAAALLEQIKKRTAERIASGDLPKELIDVETLKIMQKKKKPKK